MVEGERVTSTVTEESVRANMEEREDVGLGVAGLYHLLKSDTPMEVMERQQSARPEVAEVRRKPREESLDGNSARNSLKSQVVTLILTIITPDI